MMIHSLEGIRGFESGLESPGSGSCWEVCEDYYRLRYALRALQFLKSFKGSS